MIKYRVNNKFVDEEAFYAELKRLYSAAPQVLYSTDILERLETNGYVHLQAKKGKPYMYEYFYKADEQVFELEQIVAENEYDPLDDDAFAVAFAIYNKGFRKQ